MVPCFHKSPIMSNITDLLYLIVSCVVIELALIDQWVTTRLGSTVCWNHLLMRCKSHTTIVCTITCIDELVSVEHSFASILKLLPSSWYPLGKIFYGFLFNSLVVLLHCLSNYQSKHQVIVVNNCHDWIVVCYIEWADF